jgi:hypothetical protein
VRPDLSTWPCCSEVVCERWDVNINEGKTRAIYFSRNLKSPRLQLNVSDIFVNNVTYLDVTFDRRMTYRSHIKRTVAKVLRTRTYFLLKSERLNKNIKVTFYSALIRSVMTHACLTWENEADAHHLKLQRLQKRVLSAI